MTFRNIALGLVFDESPDSTSAMSYAISLARLHTGRLTSLLCVPEFALPSARLVPNLRTMVEEVNAERMLRAQKTEETIEADSKILPFSVQSRVMTGTTGTLIQDFSAAIRLSDICVLPQPSSEMAMMKDMVEAALFHSGRPVIIVPETHKAPARFNHIVIAWDGSARAARAIGDAMPLLEQAGQVDIVCVSGEPKKSFDGSDLAEYLSTRCKNIELFELLMLDGDIGDAIATHAAAVSADLIVMGAFAHARFLQIFLGGTTNEMILYCNRPVFLSY